ncbi:MAG: hypothetical protein OXQ29_11915 [Rhodospirillaceae bacterium]|nr:hypothetical protein [Rhodospirillaceae bacterium]
MPLSDNDRRRWMRRVERDQRLVIQQNAPVIRDRFQQLARQVAASYEGRGLTAALATARAGNEGFAQLFATIWIQSGVAAGEQIADFVNAPINPSSREMLRRTGANRVTRISRRTREGIRRSIEIGQQAGLTPRAIATGQGEAARILMQETTWRPLRSVVEQTYRNRDLAIVRTETALAHQAAANSEYAYHGVERVEWLDSPDCGVNGHDDSEKANGQIVTLARNARYPISHPNCVRAAAPVVDRVPTSRAVETHGPDCDYGGHQ